MAAGRWLVFDTSVYIAALRGGLESAAAEALRTTIPRTYLASVVAAELHAGATSERGRRAVLAVTQPPARAGRVVTPSATSWIQAGDLLSELRHRDPGLRSRLTRLWNDALIALSARQVGAAVVTTDLRDFVLLGRYL
ncbi:MAG: type II toxin-antitoxin system VapC family toxin, partial [Candidatus Rokuibacteriota bacterium]